MLPFAAAPYTQWGGAAQGEFQRRYLGADLTYIRRGALTLGWTPTRDFSVWSELGLTSLQILAGAEPTGALGPSFGLGGTLAAKKPLWRYWTPLIAARATQNQSKLSDDQYPTGRPATSRRSCFDWLEGWGCIGAYKYLKHGLFFSGLTLRFMMLDERRMQRTGSAVQTLNYNYNSGIKPGLGLGMRFNMPHRLNLWLFAEVFDGGARLSVNVGQWGTS